MTESVRGVDARHDAEESLVRDLVRTAGRRPEPSAAIANRVRQAVEADWRATVAAVHRRWLTWPLAAAAGLTIAASAWIYWPRATPARPAAARVALASALRVEGGVSLSSPAGAPARGLAAGASLASGDLLASSESGRAALAMADGVSLRLDRSTQLSFEAPRRVRLDRGRIYVDASRLAEPVAVVTDAGVVRDVGTQFDVAIIPGAGVEVRVREGAAVVDRAAGEISVGAAEAVRIDPAGRVDRRAIATSGAEWRWIADIAPQFVVEGATLGSYLDWVAREQGLRWQYASDADAKIGAGVVLHGSIEGLTPAESLEAVLPTCGMTHQTARSVLVIRRTRESR